MVRMIPSTIHSSVRSGAERRMFKIIENTPHSEDWICLHSLGLARHVSKRRGEIDFLLLCNHGIFVLEVKGGRLRREEGFWIFINKYGTTFRKSEGPFDQASGAMFTLEGELRRKFPDTPLSRAMLGYGVVIPDVKFEDVGSEADPLLVYDIRDRARPFDAYVTRLAEFTRSVQPFSRKGLKKNQILELADFLRRDFDLVPSVSTVLEDTHNQLTELTKQQFAVLDSLESQPRVLVEGVAGSGKTLLALEAARRQARSGANVLILCYNKNLAAKIGSVVLSEDYLGKIVAKTLHGYCRKLINDSSLLDTFKADCSTVSVQRQFDELYPEYATLAMYEGVSSPYDILIVDEAQDVLTESVLELVSCSVKGGLENGSWQLYLDSNNQASVYGRMDPTVLDRLRPMASYHVLTANCRNSKQIAQHTAILSCAQKKTIARAEGPPVDFCGYENKLGWTGTLTRVLESLKKESVPREQIVVLVPKNPPESIITNLNKLGMKRLTDEDVPLLSSPGSGRIFWSPVSGFKGLESDVIVLAGIEDIENDWWRAVTYVGMSRARTRLIVILERECEPIRVLRLQEELERELGESEIDL